MKFIYFGHSRMLYDTEEEKRAIEGIRLLFPNYRILNPNKKKHQDNCNDVYTGVPGTEMEYFLNLTKMCEFGVFLVYDADKWSPGSYTEATYMMNNGKDVYMIDINDWTIRLIDKINSHYSFSEEKEYLLKKGKDPSLVNENG